MPIHCPFTTLADSTVALQDLAQETDLANWLVAWNTHGDDGLFYTTNCVALVFALNEVHGQDTARLADGDRGGKVALVRPERPEALALAAAYAAEMLAGQHLNMLLYRKAMDETCADRWSNMDLSDRIELIQALRGNVGEALPDTVPACVRPSFEEIYE
jgi:hypothetical protein